MITKPTDYEMMMKRLKKNDKSFHYIGRLVLGMLTSCACLILATATCDKDMMRRSSDCIPSAFSTLMDVFRIKLVIMLLPEHMNNTINHIRGDISLRIFEKVLKGS